MVFKTGTGELLGKVNAVVESLNLEAGRMLGGQHALLTLHLAAQLLDGTLVTAHVLLVLLLEELHEVGHDTLVEVLTTQVGVAVGREDLKDAVVNGEHGDVKGA